MVEITTEQLGWALANADLSGFTNSLKGEPKRFIIGLTNNVERDLKLLVEQASYFKSFFSTLTIGWWTDTANDKVYIDVGTTLNDLDVALKLAQFFQQQCIWDSFKEEEIEVPY